MRPLDILPLRALVAAAQQDHNLRPTLHILNAVAAAISDPHAGRWRDRKSVHGSVAPSSNRFSTAG
jgi:hypothetical protein